MSELNLNDLEHVSGGASAEGARRTYIVQPGDTLSEIAAKYGTTTKKLSLLNADILIASAEERGIKISDPSEYADHIYAGQILRLP